MHGSKVMGLISLDSCACTCIYKGLISEFIHDLNNNCDARKPIFKVSDQASLFGFRD